MKKIQVLAAALILPLLSANLVAQEAVSIDGVLKSVSEYFEKRMPQGSKLAILGFSSESPALSSYIVEELSANIVNSDYFVLVDRSNLASIEKEMSFQLSGEVDDRTVQAIGKKLGAESIVLGSITRLGSIYRLRARAVEVKTAKVLGIQTMSIKRDATLQALTKGGVSYGGSSGPKDINFGGGDSYGGASYGGGSDAVELNFGGGLGGAFNFYDTNGVSFPASGSKDSLSLAGGLLFGVRLLKFLELHLDLLFTSDKAIISVKDEDMGGWTNDCTYTFNTNTFLLPVSLKIPIDTGKFSLAPAAAFYAGFPIKDAKCRNETTKESWNSKMSAVFGIGGGIALNIKLGPGALFFDLRYLHDLKSTHIEDDTHNFDIYNTRRILFFAGYYLTKSFGGSK